jgi:PAS domain S-box-containing protein
MSPRELMWRRTRSGSLRWRFMLAPAIGVVMMAALAGAFVLSTQEQDREFANLQDQALARAQSLTQLSNRLAGNHAQIYELLRTAETGADEGEFYDAGKPYLFAIHDIEAALETELQLQGLAASEMTALSSLLEQTAAYRLNTTNAMLMATVNLALARTVMGNSTEMFNRLNAEFSAANQAVHVRLDEQLVEHRKRTKDQTRLFTFLFVAAIVIALAIGIGLSRILSRDLNRMVSRLADLISAETADGASVPSIGNEVKMLARAIEDVRTSYAFLARTRRELDETNQSSLEREKALRENEALLKTIIDSSPNGIVLRDWDGVCLLANTTTVRWMNVNEADVVGTRCTDFYSEQTAAQIDEINARAISSGHAILEEMKMSFPDGVTRDLLVHKIPISLGSAEFDAVVTVSSDLTDVRHSEEVRQQLSDAVQHVPMGIALFDKGDRLVFCNEQSRESLSFLDDFLKPGTGFDALLRALAALQLRSDPKRHNKAQIQERLSAPRTPMAPIDLKNDGRWYQVAEIRIPDGSSFLTVTDITERKQVENELNEHRRNLEDLVKERTQELEDSERTFRDLYDESPELLISVDGSTQKVIECNETVLTVLGFTKEELVGKDLLDLYHPDSHAAAKKAFQEFLTAGEVVNAELQVVKKDGEKINVLLDARSHVDKKTGKKSTVSVLRDITERKRMEQALLEANEKLQELDHLKTMFIASVSHELRTPLNSIIGFSGVMLGGLSGDLNDEQRDSLGRINRAGTHLLSLISDVIDISKIEAGLLGSELESFSLGPVVDDAVSHIQPALAVKGMDVSVDAPSWPQMHTDKKRLYQCIFNLLSNASKFTEEGSITLSVREDGAMVEISVKDTGIGMAEEDLPKLFQPFERLENRLQVKAGGTGLGLYLVRKIVEEVLSGSVSVTSRPGRGSTFTLRLPRELDGSERRNPIDRAADEMRHRSA